MWAQDIGNDAMYTNKFNKVDNVANIVINVVTNAVTVALPSFAVPPSFQWKSDPVAIVLNAFKALNGQTNMPLLG